jgi:two-component system LytT family sensor kinase
MKKYFLSTLLLVLALNGFAQIKWSEDSVSSGNLEWNNYSTSYLGDIDDRFPFLVTAIPYNGMYSNFDEINTPLDLSFKGSLYRFRSDLSDYYSRKLYTFDSSEVYFLALNIYKSNAKDYEYRVVLNATTEIKPWSDITQFSDFRLNKFKEGCGFLGGYKTTWGNYIVIELRKKNTDIIFSSAIVYWKEIKPVVNAVYTSKNLNEFFNLLRHASDQPKKTSDLSKLTFPSTENTIIYYLTADIFKKEAIEYELEKDGKVFREWKANDYDNNFIWLKDLSPGKYKLKLRYRAQRHNISTYDFEITPQWQQTTTFKIITGSLLAAFVGFIALLIYSAKQKGKLKQTQSNKEKIEMNLQSLRSQLNPHFIFNALSSIQSLINTNQTEAANNYLTKFSELLRQTLQYNNSKMIPLAIDIQLLDTYIKLEQLRFHFNYTLTVDESLHANTIEIPPMLFQPIAENAVKHGISALQTEGTLQLSFCKNNKDVIATIKDNGKGFNKSQPGNGYGLKLTTERIAYFNESATDQHINLNIETNTETGTTISLTFKNWI